MSKSGCIVQETSFASLFASTGVVAFEMSSIPWLTRYFSAVLMYCHFCLNVAISSSVVEPTASQPLQWSTLRHSSNWTSGSLLNFTLINLQAVLCSTPLYCTLHHCTCMCKSIVPCWTNGPSLSICSQSKSLLYSTGPTIRFNNSWNSFASPHWEAW